MREPDEQGDEPQGMLDGFGRTVVTLMWALLLVMIVVVAVLAHRFYG